MEGFNWFGMGVATAVYYGLGAIWFTPAFGAVWDRAIGFARPRGWRPGGLYYFGPLLECCIATIATSVLIHALEPGGLADAAVLGLVAGVGYGATVSVVNAITPHTPHTPRPLLLGAVTGAYHAVGLVPVAIVLFLFT